MLKIKPMLLAMVLGLAGIATAEAQIYNFNACPPGSVLVNRRVPSAYGYSTVAQCQYVAGVQYYGYQPGRSIYFQSWPRYYRTPSYYPTPYFNRTPYYNRTPFYQRTPYYYRGTGRR